MNEETTTTETAVYNDPPTNEWDYKISLDEEAQETERTRITQSGGVEQTRITQEGHKVSYRNGTVQCVVICLMLMILAVVIANTYLHKACMSRGLQWKGTYCEMTPPKVRLNVSVDQLPKGGMVELACDASGQCSIVGSGGKP